jgi:hypothetical protein
MDLGVFMSHFRDEWAAAGFVGHCTYPKNRMEGWEESCMIDNNPKVPSNLQPWQPSPERICNRLSQQDMCAEFAPGSYLVWGSIRLKGLETAPQKPFWRNLGVEFERTEVLLSASHRVRSELDFGESLTW